MELDHLRISSLMRSFHGFFKKTELDNSSKNHATFMTELQRVA